ncbi:MAG: hypothetical protein K2G96_03560, partial [Clostridia bacterium]|nr:hypothetical protein [Clostridia bacterium]
MAIKPPDEGEAKKLILEYLPDNKSIPKETLLYNCAVAYLQKHVPNETERHGYMEDKTPGALWNKINCELGKTRKQLTTSGIIAEDESGHITKNVKKDIADDEAIEIQNIILELTSERKYTKKELLDSICSRYKAKKLKNLRSYAGQVLISLYENNELKKSDSSYF